jgi:hypothetical protein
MQTLEHRLIAESPAIEHPPRKPWKLDSNLRWWIIGIVVLGVILAAVNARAQDVVEVDHTNPESMRQLFLSAGWREILPPPTMPLLERAEIQHRWTIACALAAREIDIDPEKVRALGLFLDTSGIKQVICLDLVEWSESQAERWCQQNDMEFVSHIHPVVRCRIPTQPMKEATFKRVSDSDFHWKGTAKFDDFNEPAERERCAGKGGIFGYTLHFASETVYWHCTKTQAVPSESPREPTLPKMVEPPQELEKRT